MVTARPQGQLVLVLWLTNARSRGKPPPEGAQIVELSTFKDPDLVELLVLENPQPIIEEITSSDEREEIELEDIVLEEDTKNPVRDEDFEIFYHTHASRRRHSTPS
nr:hypothetical protein CFP56_02452 [Quercus suber]